MSACLHLADGLSIPLDVVTEKLGFLGRTGSGKSYAAMLLAELMHKAGGQFVALDPVGVWWGLRLAADGKGAGIPVPVLGGLHGDIPLEPTAGTLVADLVADRGTSMVLDVSQFESDAQKAKFASDFLARFFFRRKSQPGAVHVFLEEAQEFVPQNPGRGEEQMLHHATRMVKLGRNYGIGCSLISQRPQEVNKKALNMTELLFVFQMTGPQERKTVEGWIADHGLEEDIAGELPKLERGHPHVWSPAWLRVSKVVSIGRRSTFDASSTPKVGAAAKDRALAPIDLEKLRSAMAATIERAKGEDPKHLRAEIARLMRELADVRNRVANTKAPAPAEKVVEKPVLKDGQLARAEKLLERIEKVGGGLTNPVAALVEASREIHTAIAQAKAPAAPAPARVHTSAVRPGAPTRLAAPRPQVSAAPRVASDTALSGPQQRVLDALAWMEAVGFTAFTKVQVGFLAGYRVSKAVGGTYGNVLGQLRAAGLIGYPAPGELVLTDAGRAVATPADVEQTTEGLQRAVFARLGETERRVLQVLVDAYPDPMSKQGVGAAAGYTVGPAVGGTFGNILGRLRSLALIDYPSPGQAVALPVLFLDGNGRRS